MFATIFDLLFALMWPMALAVASLAIARRTLTQSDTISSVVYALTGRGPSAQSDKFIVVQHAEARPDAARRSDAKFSSEQTRQRPGATLYRLRSRRPLRSVIREGADRGDPTTRFQLSRSKSASESAVCAKGTIEAAATVIVICAALLAFDIAVSATSAQAGRYEFDQRRTEVRFVYKMAYSTQRGRFTKVSGILEYDEAKPDKSKISASIATASLTTGQPLVDNELKGAAFFNVDTSPVITFKSLEVTARSAEAADVAGEITVNGITKPVVLKVSVKPYDDPALKHDAGVREFIATARIQRSAFKMTDYQSMVDDDIDIEIDAIVRPRAVQRK